MPAAAAASQGPLYVISSRKPVDDYRKIRRFRTYKREVHLHAPKRAGTYILSTAPLDRARLEEADLIPVREDGLPLDTDLLERGGPQPEADRQERIEDRIAAVLAGLGTPLVLFVHGYNVEVGEALRSGQLLQRQLERHGSAARVIVFRWPSNGHLLDYFPDQQAAGRFGSYALVNLLRSLHRVLGGRAPIHCLAHSMGTYVVTRALSTIATLHLHAGGVDQRDGGVLDELVFMQPDVDFDCLCSGYVESAWDSPSYLEIPDGYAATKLVHRLTIYCSTNDVALFASLFKNRTKRLGAYGPGLETRTRRDTLMSKKVRQNVHVVNCDDWYLFDPSPGDSHSHFLNCPNIMQDVAATLGGAVPQANPQRTTLAPRWYRLGYRRPGPLPALARFWKAVGSLCINGPMMALVKFKKWIQFATGLVRLMSPLVALLLAAISGAAWRDHPVGFGLMVASGGILVVYGLLWLLGKWVQRRQDHQAAA